MNKKELLVMNDVGELNKIVELLESLSLEWNIPAELITKINLVIEEIFTNIVFYAYQDKDPHEITLALQLEGRKLEIRLEDDGIAFNPLKKSDPDNLDSPAEEREIGGLGIFLVKQLMDNVEYRRNDNRNILSMFLSIGQREQGKA